MTTHMSNHMTVQRTEIVNAQLHAALGINDPDSNYWARQYNAEATRFEGALTEAQYERWLWWTSGISMSQYTFKRLAEIYQEANEMFASGETGMDWIAYQVGFTPPCTCVGIEDACVSCGILADHIALKGKTS